MFKLICYVAFNLIFKRSLNYSNLKRVIEFSKSMSKYVPSMRELKIIDGSSKVYKCSPKFVCIDYGLIFSASSEIKRYIITDDGNMMVIKDYEFILPCN